VDGLSCCACCGGDLGDGRVEEMLSLWRLLPESLAERVRRWVRRGPHVEWPGSVCVPGAMMGVFADASMDMRDRRLCTCSLKLIVPWWRSLGGWRCLQLVALRRGTALVTTVQVAAACFSLLSLLVRVGGVWF
jgi:hypothetical protein